MTKCPHCDSDRNLLSTSQPNRTKPAHSEYLLDTLMEVYADAVNNGDGYLGKAQLEYTLMKHDLCLVDARDREPNRMGTTPEMQKMYDEFGGETLTLWKLLRKHGVGLYTAQMICNDAMLHGVTVPAALAAAPAVGGEALEPVDNTIVNCARFVKWVLQEGPWQGTDLDGGGVQDKAESFGLIVSVPYDPEKHGAYNDCGCDAGDPWFEFSPALNAAAQPAPAAEPKTDWRAKYREVFNENKRIRAALEAAQPASPLRGRLAIAKIIDPDARWGEVIEAGSDDDNQILLALEKADEILSASPPEQPAAGQPFSVTVATALWQAWLEMNTIRARDGIPYQSYAGGGVGKSDVSEDYWSKCVDDLAAAYLELTGFEIMPWSPSTQFLDRAALQHRGDET